MTKKQPIRTCAVCRVQAPKELLERFVVREGELIPDPPQQSPGRGAYVHHDHDLDDPKVKAKLIRTASGRKKEARK